MSRSARAVLVWVLAVAAAVAAIGVAGFTSPDPDSTAYAVIGARMAQVPVARWIAVEWWGAWGFDGLFREHPLGTFVVPALLARTGYPAEQASYAVGAVWSALAVVMIGRVASRVVAEDETPMLQWAALILPIAFVYRIRANQEYPVMALLLVAVYAVDRVRERRWWSAVVVAAAVAVFLIKGIFVIFVPIVCALWLLTVRWKEADTGAAWVAVVCSVVAVAVVAWGYEAVYRRVVGESFFTYYLEQRLAPGTGVNESGATRALMFPYNLVWYGARVLWFGVPGSLLLLWARWRRRERGAAGVWFAVGVAFTYVVILSIGSSKADRFIFPAYFAVGVAGAAVAVRYYAGVARIGRRIARWQPYGTPALWLALFLLRFVAGRRLPYIEIWSP